MDEIAHDTLYKPAEQKAPPVVERLITRSMAMIEATDESFGQAMEKLNEVSRPQKDALHSLVGTYRDIVGQEPEKERMNDVILAAFPEYVDSELPKRVAELIRVKPFIGTRIKQHASYLHLFRQAAVLLAYLAVQDSPIEAKTKWPFVPTMLDPVYTDLGISSEMY